MPVPEGKSLRDAVQGHKCPCSLQDKNLQGNSGSDCHRRENLMRLPWILQGEIWVGRRVVAGHGGLNLLKVGEFFHEFLHAVPDEQNGQLGVSAVAFALENGVLAVFAVTHALTFFQVGGTF